MPYASTNYGKFSVRFKRPSIWNTIESDIKLSFGILMLPVSFKLFAA